MTSSPAPRDIAAVRLARRIVVGQHDDAGRGRILGSCSASKAANAARTSRQRPPRLRCGSSIRLARWMAARSRSRTAARSGASRRRGRPSRGRHRRRCRGRAPRRTANSAPRTAEMVAAHGWVMKPTSPAWVMRLHVLRIPSRFRPALVQEVVSCTRRLEQSKSC